MPITYDHDHEHEITLFAETNFRNQKRRFGIKTDDRRRHVYVLGKTGMGKTTLLENLVLSDIVAGHGCCYIDPHGDTAEKMVDFIPSHRINDVVYFNPADTAFPMGFNILETDNEEQKPLVASGLMGVFKKIWPDVWSPRMEYILMNCVLALLDYPGATLLGISRILVDKEYRARVTAKIRDPIVKTFWVAEFTSWSEKYATEAIAPVQNKVGQFLSSSVIRNIVAQVKSTVNFRQIMDDGKICIVNLSKGRIGEDNMRLLGGMVVTKIQLAAQERQNIREQERRDFYLFVDEFQNFANESFATILSEARKYRLNLVIAHQYIEQLDEKVAPAVIGNVGTLILMRVGGNDATFFETEFAPTFTPEDMVSLAKYQIYIKLMVDGVATPPFSASTIPPIAKCTDSAERVIQVSRERYAEPRALIEEKVLRWSGFEVPGSTTGHTEAEPVTVPAATPAAIAYQVASAVAPPPILEYPKIETEEEKAELDLEGQQTGGEYLLLKPERLAAIAAATGAAGGRKKDRPKFVHVCSRCGKTWELAIQLDPTRPMYCLECRPIVMEEKKQRGFVAKQISRTLPPPEAVTSLVEEGAELSLETVSRSASHAPANRPRAVAGSAPAPASQDERGSIKLVVDPVSVKERLSLLDEIAQAKGHKLELDKKVLEERASRGERRDDGRGSRDERRGQDGDRLRDRQRRRERGRDRGRDRQPDKSHPDNSSGRQAVTPPASQPQGPKTTESVTSSTAKVLQRLQERQAQSQDTHPSPASPSATTPASSSRPLAPGQRVQF